MNVITTAELKVLRKRNKDLKLINVLPAGQYQKCHIAGSSNVPWAEDGFVQRVDDLVDSRDDAVVVHDLNRSSELSAQAARKLEEHGFSRVVDYEGGIEDWLRNGHPVQSFVRVRGAV